MPFRKVLNIVEADEQFRKISSWRKTPSQATVQGVWFDISLSPGNPSPIYYAASPLKATQLKYSIDGGINHGLSVSPKQKVLRKFTTICTTAAISPMPIILCDYLLYYPFVDESSNDEQVMDNTITLPRYTDGEGVKIMPVMVAPGSAIAGVQFTCTYTNQNGVSGRVTPLVDLTIEQTVVGTLGSSAKATSNYGGPFIPLQSGDTGVRSIESITFPGVTDVGLLTFVLVKPLAQAQIRSATGPVELDYLKDFIQAPVIQDDAFLSFICCPNGTLATVPIHGLIETSWA